MAKVLQRGNRNTTVAQGATSNFPEGSGSAQQQGTETACQRTVRATGVSSNLYVNITVNTISSTSTSKTRIGAVNGNQTASITANTAQEYTDSSNTDTFSAGNIVNLQTVGGAGGTSLTWGTQGDLFDATSNSAITYHTAALVSSSATSTTFFYTYLGGKSATSETSDYQFKMKESGTVKQYCANVTNNPRASDTILGSRKDGGNGNLSVTMTASTTGQFEDSSNSDTVISGSLINRYTTTGGVGVAVVSFSAFNTFETTDSTATIIEQASASAVTVNASATQYVPISGRDNSATEATVQTRTDLSATTSLYEVYLTTNTITGDGTAKFRKNAGNGNGSVTLTGLATLWFEDTSNTDTLITTDEINWQLNGGALGTSMVFNTAALVMTTSSPVTNALGIMNTKTGWWGDL